MNGKLKRWRLQCSVSNCNMTASVVLILALLGFCILQIRKLYWTRRGIPHTAGPHLLLGNVRGIWSTEHSSTLLQKIYREFKRRELSVGGFNFFCIPSILLVDSELARRMLSQTDGLHSNARDDLMSHTLFEHVERGWRKTHEKLTALYDANMMKRIFPVMAGVAEEMRVETSKNIDREDSDVEDFVGRYTTHVISTCVFGVRCRTIQLARTEFREMCDRTTEFCWFNLFRQWILVSFPNFARVLQIKRMVSSEEKFFIGLTTATVLHRECYGIRKDDILQGLIRLHREQKITKEELSGHCFSFVKFGLEPCNSVMKFCIYELARNPLIQDRLRSEIKHSLNGMELDYKVATSMTYLSQVINETLRMYPPVDYLCRVSQSNSLNRIPSGALCVIPVYALHHDPDHFPVPEQFDPERFSPNGTQTSTHQFCYLPFGAGPRSCIGYQFGLMLIKIGIITLVRNFRFVPNGSASQIRFKPNSLRLSPAAGSWNVRLERLK
ncbi:probable cytochrome P450 6a18 [Malaya genurostris]|uniref:probable cytochrome P450 6a18 n=1 Tax=Malaya genurostris TaxID=325434 RepID=UPI0026F40186|nr:probable cytochrome P450 6a18 [Malaya genurostris]